jgi:hypothetical protein
LTPAEQILIDMLRRDDRTREELRSDVQLLIRAGGLSWPAGITFDETVRQLEREGRIETRGGQLVLVPAKVQERSLQKELF